MTEKLSHFLDNRWTATIVPIVFVGGISWALFSSKMDALEVSRSSDHIDIKTLKIDQAKDNEFRQRGDRFNSEDALKLELRLRKEFKNDINEMAEKFSNSIKSSQSEQNRRLERMEDKIDKGFNDLK